MAKNYPKRPRRGDGCLNKRALDIRLASNLGMSWRKVAAITDAYIDELLLAIAQHGGFVLPRLGKLRVHVETNNTNIGHAETPTEPQRIRLYFSKSAGLKEMLERSFGIHEHDRKQRRWTSKLMKR